jgi:hypothetical protein
MPLEYHPRKSWISFFTGTMVGMVMMSKTNLGILYAMVFTTYWLFIAHKPTDVLYFILGAMLSFSVLLFGLTGDPYIYFRDAIWNYGMQQFYRFTRDTGIQAFPKSYFLILCVVFVNVDISRNVSKLKEKLVLFLGLLFIGFLAVKSSSLGTSNTPLRGMQIALAFMLIYESIKLSKSVTAKRIAFISIIFLILLSIAFGLKSFYHGWTRDKWLFSRSKLGDYSLKTKPLNDWLFEKEDGLALDEIVPYIQKNIPENESILIASNVLIINLLIGRESYKGLPYIYSSDLVASPEQRNEIQTAILSNPPTWIITEIVKNIGKEANDLNFLKYKILDDYKLFKIFGNRLKLYKRNN